MHAGCLVLDKRGAKISPVGEAELMKCRQNYGRQLRGFVGLKKYREQ
jgi:hypothetical protein